MKTAILIIALLIAYGIFSQAGLVHCNAIDQLFGLLSSFLAG